MAYVFVQTSHDYSDEFDVTSCSVWEQSEWHKAIDTIIANFSLIEGEEFPFGTNESLKFRDIGTLLSGILAAPCSEAFAAEFTRYAPGGVGFDVISEIMFWLAEATADDEYEEE